MNEGVQSLIAALRNLDAPESLFPLAATANGLLSGTADGSIFVAHLVLLQAARRVQDEPLTEREWLLLKAVVARLADVLEQPADLDALASAWRDWTQPAALH